MQTLQLIWTTLLSNVSIAPAILVQYGFNNEFSTGSSGKCWKPVPHPLHRLELPLTSFVIAASTCGPYHEGHKNLLPRYRKWLPAEHRQKRTPCPHRNHKFQISVFKDTFFLKGVLAALFLNLFLSSECVLHCMWSQKSQPALSESIRPVSWEGWHFINTFFFLQRLCL